MEMGVQCSEHMYTFYIHIYVITCSYLYIYTYIYTGRTVAVFTGDGRPMCWAIMRVLLCGDINRASSADAAYCHCEEKKKCFVVWVLYMATIFLFLFEMCCAVMCVLFCGDIYCVSSADAAYCHREPKKSVSSLPLWDIRVYAYVCICVCEYIYMCICMYIYIGGFHMKSLEEEDPPWITTPIFGKIGFFFSGGVLFLRVRGLEPTKQRNPPREGGGFWSRCSLKSRWAASNFEWAASTATVRYTCVYICVCVYICTHLYI